MTILTRNHSTLALEVKAHINADSLVRGEYWNGSKGCFIGCLTHSSDPKPAFERFGLPEPLMRIAESIFEDLPDNEGRAFFAALPDAVGCDGKDLSRVHWAFLATELRTLPQLDLVATVISGMDLLAAGKEWSVDDTYDAYTATRAAYFTAADAAQAAHSASAEAFDAYDVAAYAAYASHYASHSASTAAYAAADASARIRQRDTLLRLISEAPMGDELHTKEKQNDLALPTNEAHRT